MHFDQLNIIYCQSAAPTGRDDPSLQFTDRALTLRTWNEILTAERPGSDWTPWKKALRGA